MATTLSDYQAEVQDLLHDATSLYWPTAVLNRAINKALQRRDRDTGANRKIQTLTLTVGVDTYNFITALADVNTVDVVSITLEYGNQRIVMGRVPYTTLTALYRPSLTFQQYPYMWARLGGAQVVLAPTPSSAYVTEWDTAVTVAKDFLVNATDADPLPHPWTTPVAYDACRQLKINERQYAEAKEFEAMYQEKLLAVTGGIQAGAVPSHYGDGWP